MKSDFYIQRVNKDVVKDLLYTHHYLKDHSKDFKSGHNYALYRKSFTDILTIGNPLGVCIFTGLPVPEIAVGAFGLQRDQQKGLYELSKLCIHPDLQKEEYNITSWFVSKAIKQFKKDTEVRAIISYADSQYHNGIIYRACNFTYCGLTDSKKDFYYENGVKHSRGSVKGKSGEWRERTRKHRYIMIFDKDLKSKLRWSMQSYR